MRQRAREARAKGRTARMDRRWIPYERISPHLRHAVLIAEDDAFFAHGGLDWNELQEAAKRDLRQRRFARGGSTITQQLAKNLYLGTERSLTRKFKELILALRLEHALTKRRIFELYLNEIEWGDGIYGVESAARHWFHTPASALSPAQSVRLAAVIINPRKYSPIAPSKRITQRIRMIASRMRRRGELAEADYRDVLGLPPLPPAWPDSGVAVFDSAAPPPVEPDTAGSFLADSTATPP